MERRKKVDTGVLSEMESLRLQRLREDGARPPSVNLAEGIALSHKLLQFTGAALKS
jgi:hypothetical protein